jgi:hypothetical protein
MSQDQSKPDLLDYFPDDDGYTLDAYLSPVPLIHNEVRIKFRPTDILERSVYLAFREKASEKQITEKLANVLAGKIESWNLVERTKDAVVPMPILPEKIKRLKVSLWMRLVNIVIWGVDGGDVDPGLPTKEMGDQIDSDMEALMDKSQAIIDKRLEEARKN